MTHTQPTETTLKAHGFDVRVMIGGEGAMVTICDTDKITDDTDDATSVSVSHKDNSLRVCTFHDIIDVLDIDWDIE